MIEPSRSSLPIGQVGTTHTPALLAIQHLTRHGLSEGDAPIAKRLYAVEHVLRRRGSWLCKQRGNALPEALWLIWGFGDGLHQPLVAGEENAILRQHQPRRVKAEVGGRLHH